MTIILGIDPGSRKTGFGIIRLDGSRTHYISSGVIRIPDTALPERLKTIFESVNEIIRQFQPQEVAV